MRSSAGAPQRHLESTTINASHRERRALGIALGSAIADALVDAVLADDTTKSEVLAKVIFDAHKHPSRSPNRS